MLKKDIKSNILLWLNFEKKTAMSGNKLTWQHCNNNTSRFQPSGNTSIA